MKISFKILPVIGMIVGTGIALAMSAFTPAQQVNKSGFAVFTFGYTPPSTDPTHPYSEANVQDVANWSTLTADSCSASDVKACSITVAGDFVDDSNPSDPALLSTIDLETQVNTLEGTAYVTGSADQDGEYVNRSN